MSRDLLFAIPAGGCRQRIMPTPKLVGEGNTALGTAGGTRCSILRSVPVRSIIDAAVLAVVGAAVRFVRSVSLRWLMRRWKQYPPPAPPISTTGFLI